MIYVSLFTQYIFSMRQKFNLLKESIFENTVKFVQKINPTVLESLYYFQFAFKNV